VTIGWKKWEKSNEAFLECDSSDVTVYPYRSFIVHLIRRIKSDQNVGHSFDELLGVWKAVSISDVKDKSQLVQKKGIERLTLICLRIEQEGGFEAPPKKVYLAQFKSLLEEPTLQKVPGSQGVFKSMGKDVSVEKGESKWKKGAKTVSKVAAVMAVLVGTGFLAKKAYDKYKELSSYVNQKKDNLDSVLTDGDHILGTIRDFVDNPVKVAKEAAKIVMKQGYEGAVGFVKKTPGAVVGVLKKCFSWGLNCGSNLFGVHSEPIVSTESEMIDKEPVDTVQKTDNNSENNTADNENVVIEITEVKEYDNVEKEVDTDSVGKKHLNKNDNVEKIVKIVKIVKVEKVEKGKTEGVKATKKVVTQDPVKKQEVTSVNNNKNKKVKEDSTKQIPPLQEVIDFTCEKTKKACGLVAKKSKKFLNKTKKQADYLWNGLKKYFKKDQKPKVTEIELPDVVKNDPVVEEKPEVIGSGSEETEMKSVEIKPEPEPEPKPKHKPKPSTPVVKKQNLVLESVPTDKKNIKTKQDPVIDEPEYVFNDCEEKDVFSDCDEEHVGEKKLKPKPKLKVKTPVIKKKAVKKIEIDTETKKNFDNIDVPIYETEDVSTEKKVEKKDAPQGWGSWAWNGIKNYLGSDPLGGTDGTLPMTL
jgi:hypothetical protein